MQDFIFSTVEYALSILQKGMPIILVDDEHRENEGDLVMPAQLATPHWINFMATEGKGLICTPMTAEHAEQLGLRLMNPSEHSLKKTAFTQSVDAAWGITTGISASDRAHTINLMTKMDSKAQDFQCPGHIFPLIAASGGVLQRPGHTEASVELCKLVGLSPVAVICEMINADGTMSRVPDLMTFSKKWDLPLLTIKALQDYIWKTQELLAESASCTLPTAYGNFEFSSWENTATSEEFYTLETPVKNTRPLVRIHSACMTSEIFHSLKCDCAEQLHRSLELVQQQGGMVIYLLQEGRGIGAVEKIKAYALQQMGLNTIEANLQLGHASDLRHYGNALQILLKKCWKDIELLSNNPDKKAYLEQAGLSVTMRNMESTVNVHNDGYLNVKIQHMGHAKALLSKKDSK